MKIRLLLLFATAFFFKYPAAYCQALNDKTLMTVAGKDISAGEFIRMLRKSSAPGSKPDAAEYLQHYINFRLKVADALNEGTDTTVAFRNELNGYRNQLAQNYLTDPDTKEKYLRMAYERSLTEINAWHILISCPADCRPEDTLSARQKALDIRERIIKGEPFEKAALESSDDPSVEINGGNLGYFSVFQMISPFEDAAYALNKGDISMPVRTPYGYHIIRIADRRPASGKVLTAHIMKMSPPGASAEDAAEAERSINEIHDRLQLGASFSELAEQYSDDSQSASEGGQMKWFGTGEIISEFAEAAFSIKDKGNYTLPVRSPYGWHIIKLLDRKAHGTYEEMLPFLESRINPGYINSLSRKAFVSNLKKEYGFTLDTAVCKWFLDNTDTLIIQGLSKYNRREIPSGNLFAFAGRQFSADEFASFIEKNEAGPGTGEPAHFVGESLEMLVSDQLIKHEDSVLEEKYPEFQYLMKEFHDGILFFDISERKIWNRMQEDSIGLLRYYEKHKHNFPGKRKMEVKIYTLSLKNGAGKLRSAYRKFSGKADCDKRMLDRFNMVTDSLLSISEAVWSEGDPGTDRLKWKKDVIRTKSNNYPSLIVINRIIEPSPLPLEEVKAEMMAGYQDFLESEWLGQLREKYPVSIDAGVLEELTKQTDNE